MQNSLHDDHLKIKGKKFQRDREQDRQSLQENAHDNGGVLAGAAGGHDGVHDGIALARIGESSGRTDVMLVGQQAANVVF